MRIGSLESHDKEQLRRSVPLAAVAAAVGVQLDDSGYGRCPFHDDHRPSFNLWEARDGTQRWGCFVCDRTGDHFDLVRYVKAVSFGEALRFVAGLQGLAPPRAAVRARTELDADSLQAYVSAAQRRAEEPANVGLLCVAADLRDESVTLAERAFVDTVLRELGWGIDERCNVVMPHYTKAGDLSGAKIRAIGGGKWAFPGSRFEELYGGWRPNRGWTGCLITEGETDYAHAILSEVDAYVLSVPSGARFRGTWLSQVGRFDQAYLGLDPDPAGVNATDRWIAALATVSVDVSVLPIPEGEDLRSCGIPVQTLMEACDE